MIKKIFFATLASVFLSFASVEAQEAEYISLEGVEARDVQLLEDHEIPELYKKIYSQVESCLGESAWNQISLEEVDLYLVGSITVPAKDRDINVPIGGAVWFSRGEAPELYLNKWHTRREVIAHEFIHLMAPHLPRQADVIDECS